MAGITDEWVRYLRTRAHPDKAESQSFTCDIYGAEIKTLEASGEHAQSNLGHYDKWPIPQAAEEPYVKGQAHLPSYKRNMDSNTQEPNNRKRWSDTNNGATGDQAVSGVTVEDGDGDAYHAKRWSPEPPITGGLRSNCSRARHDSLHDFEARSHKKSSARQLWTSEDGVPPKSQGQGRTISLGSPRQGPRTKANGPSQPVAQPARPLPNDNESTSKIMHQPETRPISQDQLIAEVKGIYAGLVMVENKCIEVDNAYSSNTDTNLELNHEQRQSFIALHRKLLHEHHDFFLASHHPSASPALRRLASKYATPARMWKHGTHFSSGLKDYRVEARVGEYQVDALADTGAQSNFISARFVDKVGLVPDDRIPHRIQLPGGKQVLSPGTVKVPFSFHGEHEEYMLDCWIIPGCTSDLTLSGPFLRATKTLTTFKNRVKESIRQSPQTRHRVNLLGNEKQRLWGSLNGRSALALPDTGSDVMLVSAEWAKKNNLEIDHEPRHRLELELADGSKVFTMGIIHNATWTFGDSAQAVCCDFYVLDDLLVDVVFSNDFIFGLDVFSMFNHFMIDLDSMPGLSEFYNVRLISKYSQELARLEEESINNICSPHARNAERVLRDRIRDAINTLDPAKQDEAWKEELQRRLIWDRHYEQHKFKAELADTTKTLPQVNGRNSSNSKTRWWKKKFLRE